MRSTYTRICYRICALIAASILLLPRQAQAQLDSETYNSLIDAWTAAIDAGRFKEAEEYALRIKANDERFYPDKFFWRTALGMAYYGQGRYREALPLHEADLRLTRRKNGPSEQLVESLLNLGADYWALGAFDKAQPLLEEAVAVGSRVLGRNHHTTLLCINNLALVHHFRGDLKEAAELYHEVITEQHRQGERNISRLLAVLNLTDVYVLQGRYQQAEAMARYGLDTARAVGAASDHPSVLKLTQNLANVLILQNRSEEALPLLERAATDAERVMGADHPDFGFILTALSSCYAGVGESEKSAAALARSIQVLEQALGRDHPRLVMSRQGLAWKLILLGQFSEAERLLRQILKDIEKTLGKDHYHAATTRIWLAEALVRQDKLDEAAALLDQSLVDLRRHSISEDFQHNVWRDLARIDWRRGDKERAVERMEKALAIIESTRVQNTGGDVERAAAFSWFNLSYEFLLGWQADLGRLEDCLSTMERARARTFLEAMSSQGIDLFAGRPASEQKELERRRTELRGRLSTLENDLKQLPSPEEGEGAAIAQQRRQLVGAVLQARSDLYRFERDLRASSPQYRRVAGMQYDKVAVDAVRTKLLPENTLLISYFVGQLDSYLLCIGPGNIRMFKLEVPEDAAAALDLPSGPLTRTYLSKVLQDDPNTALLPQLTSPVPSEDTDARLHALRQILLPDELLRELTSESLKQLIILPDGPLALLPFEALVIESGPPKLYLLDQGPAISYAPSAAILLRLADRADSEATPMRVLTVGDPLYERTGVASSRAKSDPRLAAQTSASPKARFRAGLKPLPYSGVESRWVAEVFRKVGAEATHLTKAAATEAGIRANIEGKQVVHLACHGLSDNAYGNFFGMLAIAPGQKPGDPRDDGMLTLAELDELDLKACRLAILSACMTNHGPEQQGEGVWALSRGFLIAGARRVVASNWVVDDAAGANLVSVMCTKLAAAPQDQPGADCATALRDAKRWVRKQSKWSSPYYWAPFVLVGRN